MVLDRLSAKLDVVFRKLKGRGVLSAPEIDTALKEVRLALLEADVHFKVVRDFLDAVREKALGREVLESLTPGHQVVKIVWDELRRLMSEAVPSGGPLPLSPRFPTVIMLVGLQGAGKTTTAAKLAQRFKKEGRRVLLAAADPRRPAAVEQLEILGRQIGVEVLARAGSDAVSVCREAVERGKSRNIDLVILDTAGRLHGDAGLMMELKAIKAVAAPDDVLLVADSMTGQDALRMAGEFHRQVGLTGVILTKMDGDARGGAMLSIRAVTGVPVRFIGVGEQLDALEPFHPDRMASRILGMGDVLTLVERAGAALTRDGSEFPDPAQRFHPASFSFEDFRDQLRRLKRMGSIESLLGMIPGAARLFSAGDVSEGPERNLKRMEAIIDSMTPKERRQADLIDGSRRRRIARGSGTTVQEVYQLMKWFMEARKLMKSLSGAQGRKGLAGLLRRV